MQRIVFICLFLIVGCETSNPGIDGSVPADATPADSGSGPADLAADGPVDLDGSTVDQGWTMPVRALCATSYAAPTDVPVGETALIEASGVVASPHNPDVLWSHNDSGDSARLFALGTDGTALGRLILPGIAAPDFEDIAAAPCPDRSGPCLWIADTGNNSHSRTNLAVYAVAEPAVALGHPIGELTASRVWSIPLSYPPGVNVDSEALVVMPDASAFYLFEKIDAASARIFGVSGPFLDGVPVTLALAGTIASPGLPIDKGRMITAADIHPTGTRLVVRVYTGVFEYRLSPGDWPGQLDKLQPTVVAWGPFSELQGEAVGYDQTGTGLWTISEDRDLKPGQPLHHYACQ